MKKPHFTGSSSFPRLRAPRGRRALSTLAALLVLTLAASTFVLVRSRAAAGRFAWPASLSRIFAERSPRALTAPVVLCTSNGTGGGLWSATATWSAGCNGGLGGVPISSDNVTVKNGDTVTIDTAAVCSTLAVGEGTSGILQYDATTGRSLGVSSNVLIASGGTLKASAVFATGSTTQSLSLGGSLTNNGTFITRQTGSTSGTRVVNVTMNSSTAVALNGTAASIDFNQLIVNLGSATTTLTPSINVNFPNNVANALTLTQGKWVQNSNTTTISNNATTISSLAEVAVGGGTFTSSSTSLTVNGKLTLTSGTVNVGNAIANSLLLSGASANAQISGGTLNVAGRWDQASSATASITGGAINLSTAGQTNSTTATFSVSSTSAFTMGSGSPIIKIYNANSGTGGDIKILTSTALSAGTLIAGNAGSTLGNIQIQSTPALNNLTLDAGSTTPNIAAALTINGTLTLTSAAISGTAPTYGASSVLKYNSGSTFNRSIEWSATSGAGFPKNVQISNNTTLDVGANSGSSTARSIGGALTIDSGSTFQMAGSNPMTAAVTISGAVTNNGTLTLSTSSGGDLSVGGGFANTGTFTNNDRTVTFTGTGSLSGTSLNFGTVVINNGASITAGTNAGVSGNWTNSGTFTPSTFTVTFNGNNVSQTLAGSTTFSNLTVNHTGSGGVTAAGSTLSVTGLFHLISGQFTSATAYGDITIDTGAELALSGAITVSGNWTNNGTFTPNGFSVTFDGTGAQTITTGGVTAGKTFAGVVINKGGGTATLAGDLSDTSLTITAGGFDQGASFNVQTGTVSVAAAGTWTDIGTGDLTLSGNVSNAGSMTFNGGTTACSEADDIAITSTGGQRAWTGAGTFSLTDVTVSNQGATPPPLITVHDGTNGGGNGLNWVFLAGCTANAYTWIGGTPGTPTDWTVGTNWSPTRVTPDPSGGDVLTFNTSPIVTNVAGAVGGTNETISALHITSGSTPSFSTGGANTLTINAGSGNTGFDVYSLAITGSNALTIKLAAGTLGAVTNTVSVAGGAHQLIGQSAGAITFQNSSFFTTSTGFSGHPFGDGSSAANGAAGSIVFASGATYSHSAGSSPFGAAGNASVVTFQTGSSARYFTATGFDASGRTYADLQIGDAATAVNASQAGTGNFQFDTLVVNSTGSANSSLTFDGSGAATITIRGNITSVGNGDGGTLPDIILTPGSGGIQINKPGGGTLTFGNLANSGRSIDLEGNTTLDTATTLNLGRRVQMGLTASYTLTANGNLVPNYLAAPGYVIGILKKNFAAAGSKSFEVGTVNGYSPVSVNATSGTFPADFTAKANAPKLPAMTGTNSLARYWALTGTGITADLTFNYLAGDVTGSEANYKIVKSDGTLTAFNPSSLDTGNHVATLNGVSSFSNWTLGQTTAVSSLNRSTPTPTNAASVTWQITFADATDGLTSANFDLVNTGLGGAPGITGVSQTGANTWDITASTGTGDGTLGLNMVNGTGLNRTVTNLPFTGEVYSIDHTAPSTTSFTRQTPATSPTGADVLVFRATFSENVINVDAADFAVTGTTAGVTSVSPVSGSVYDVTVSGGDLAGLNGTVGLNFSGSLNITDAAGNPLPNSEPTTDQTYTVENAPPCPAPSTVYVNQAWAGATPGSDPDGIGPAQNFGCDSFATIKDGVAGVAPGGTVMVAAGTYAEGDNAVNIDKSITITGPNSAISPNGLTPRVAEAVITSQGSNISPNAVFVVDGANRTVTVQGFKFDGTPSAMNAYSDHDTVTLQKNIFTATHDPGMYFETPNLTINDNRFVDITTQTEDTIFVGRNVGTARASVSITDNVWSNVSTAGGNLETISGTISGNTFNNVAYYGFLIVHDSGNLNITGNSFNNMTNPDQAGVPTWGAGIRFYEPAVTSPVNITGNTFTNSYTGVGVRGVPNDPTADISGMPIHVNFNRFIGNNSGISDGAAGTLDAENNWWGCNYGPGTGGVGCTGTPNGIFINGSGTVDADPWIVLMGSATPSSIAPGGTSTVAADMTHNSTPAVPTGTLPDIPDSYNATHGTMNPTTGTIVAGSASSVFTSTDSTSAVATITVDGQKVDVPVTVNQPVFTIDDVTHLEGNAGTTAYLFTVTKTGATAFTTSVDYKTVDGTAVSTGGSPDFTAITNTTLTFAPTDTTKQFTVLVNGDNTVEPDEAFTVQLSNAVDATIGNANGTGTITNDDTEVSVAVSPASVAEDGASNLAYTFTRSGVTTGALTINFSVAGTANLATDYAHSGADTFTASSGTVTFGAGNSTAVVTIDPEVDSTYEADETVILTVTAGSGYNVGSPSAATGTIANDDAVPATLVVNKTADTDDGFCTAEDCSLREAISNANINPDANTINFNIPNTDPGFAGGVYTIKPTTQLPTVFTNITIDGSSQTTVADTNPDGPEIVLNGGLSSGAVGLLISGDGNTIKSLVVNGFGNGGILISHNNDQTPSNNQILNNYVGTNAAGTAAVANTGVGVDIHGYGSPSSQASGNTVQGNVISGNTDAGLGFCDAASTTVSGNFIGTDRTGVSDVHNGSHGILFQCTGDRDNTFTTNTIAFNLGDGIRDVGVGSFHFGNKFSQNSIFENTGLGINLIPNAGVDGVTPNDAGDADTGANGLQNFPIITSAKVTGPTKTIKGTLNSIASQGFTIEFFANAACDGSGNGEGKTYLGSTPVTTDGSGNGSFTFHPATLSVGDIITATATDGSNNTSEFSACFTAVAGTPGTLQFSTANTNDTELNASTHPVTVTVTRTGGSDGDVSVHYATSDGTATSGSDYDSASGDLTWLEGDSSSKTFDVTIHGDTTYEANETVNLTLSNAQVAALGSPNTATITIVNDDAPPATLVVNTTDDNDFGACLVTHCSLREAINAANFSSDANTINFNIPNTDPGFQAGVYTIKPLTGEYALTQGSTTINGASQTSFGGNTNVAGPEIVIDGSSNSCAPFTCNGFTISSSANTLRDLVVNNFTANGITMFGGSNNTITGCYVGTDAAGTAAAGNTAAGITSSGGNTIGGLLAGEGNVISGNGFPGGSAGIALNGSGDTVSGNRIGTNAAGTAALANKGSGIVANVGGSHLIQGNLISGNTVYGIELANGAADSSTVKNNKIGTDAAGTTAIANGSHGIRICCGAGNNTIGGSAPGDGNIIAFNGGAGVVVQGVPSAATGATGNRIFGNSIFENTGLGIDLGNDGVTPNDPGDADTDPDANNLQNFPIIRNVLIGGPNTVRGTLNSIPSQSFTIDVYRSPACDPSGNGEGKTYLGSTTTTTGANGDGLWSFTAATVSAGDVITATATDAAGNTSEFSACFTATTFSPGTIAFSQANIDSNETNSSSHTVDFTVTRTGGSDGAVSVSYAITDGSATTADNDYSASPASGTLSWPNGNSTPKTITVTVNGDTKFEPDEIVNLALSSPTGGAALGTSAATLTIKTDDTQPTISIDNVTQNEGNAGTTSFNFTVSLSNASYLPITVDYATANDTATAPSDFTGITTTQLTFSPGETTKPVSVLVNGDNTFEATEQFFVNLSNPNANATIFDSQGVGTITNDDSQPKISIDNVTHNEGNVHGVNDDPDLTSYEFTVSLSNPSDQTITVDYATANDTATAPADYTAITTTQLTFNPGETSKPVTVTVNGDTAYELTEQFFVNLSNPNSNATILDGQGVGTITNDDAAPTLAIGDRSLNEGTNLGASTSFNFTVTKTGITEVNATVNFATADGTATGNVAPCPSGNDYQTQNGSLTFLPNETTKTITVPVCKDPTFEGNETFFVNLSGEANATLSDSQGQGTILNDDIPSTGFLVNTTDDTDDGVCNVVHCSLREAINAANGASTAVAINFAIPAADPNARHFYYANDGVAGQVTLANVTATTASDDTTISGIDPDWPHSWWSILPLAPLPAATKQVFMDGYSQPGASVNALTTGDNAVLRIELDGASAGTNVTGLTLTGGTSTVRGLAINRFQRDGAALTPAGIGIDLQSGSDTVTGNFIGADVSGTIDLGNGGSGISTTSFNETIGGSTPDVVNLISGNDGNGISFSNSNTNVILGNLIGTKANGTAALGNSGSGISLSGLGSVANAIGGTGAGEANTIAFNGADGVRLDTASFGNSIRGNSIFSNGTTNLHLGIDLGADGVTANDAKDPDTGPNGLQNFPVITSALVTGSTRTITGTLNSSVGDTFTIDFYQSPACDTAGNGEGKTWLGSMTTGVTDSNGDVSFTFHPAVLTVGQVVTATATSAGASFSTSEFSACATVSDGSSGAGDIQFTSASYSVAENVAGQTVGITLTRVGGSNGSISAQFNTTNGSATAGSDYTDASQTVTFGEGETSKTINITIADDSIYEGNETVNLSLGTTSINAAQPDGEATLVADPHAAVLTINENDPAPSFTIDDVTHLEGNSGTTSYVFTVTKTGSTALNAGVSFQTQNSTATTSDNDYQTSSGTLSFLPADTTKTITVLVNGDLTVESNEAFFVNLSSPTNAAIADNQGVGTITNDDTDVSVAVSPSSVAEDGATNLVYTFTRAGVTSGALTVNFSVGGSAAFGTDYTQTGAASFTAASGTVTFGAGNSTATVTVDPSSDTTVEGNETVVLTVTTGAGYNIASPSSATGTINNDDTDVTIASTPFSVLEDGSTNIIVTFTRTGVTSNSLTVNFSVGGDAGFGSDYTQTGAASFGPSSGTVTFAPGSSTASITIDPTADTTVEPDEDAIFIVTSGTGYNVGSPSATTAEFTNDDTSVSVAVSPPAVSEDGAGLLSYTFTRNGVISNPLTVSFSVGGTATFGTDYTQTGAATFGATSGTVTFGAGNANATVVIDPTPDISFEPNETVVVTVTSGTGYTAGSPSAATGTINNDDAAGGIIQFTANNYATTENSRKVTITVQRLGDTSGAVTVNYATPDDSEASVVSPCSSNASGIASPRCDFTTALGTIRFADGDNTPKTFDVLISQDSYVEPLENFTLTLSNLTGSAVFGVNSTATVTITDDDFTPPTTNPIDDASNFVRQQYHDFLNREPDQSGLDFWTNEITSCGSNQQCIDFKRVQVSAAFYLSIEFQDTGYLVERLYKTSYGDANGTSTFGGAHQLPVPVVRFSEFLGDTQEIGQGVVVGAAGWPQALENNKVAFADRFVQRARFVAAFPLSMTPAQFVDKLNLNAGNPLSQAERDQLVADLTSGAKTRAQVLRAVAEDQDLKNAEFNRAFVLMQYFGYLRRNANVAPDSDYSGYDFWLTKLNQFNGNFQNADMVKAFITSGEYRGRSGP